ncbi:MAG: N-acetylmuramoyl-L-alanine amidase [Mariprofundaceae bacterium]|nr:N-acetylmuramoyl-L-alanine amidase [Mariprofundaceae bacterium]
MGGILLLLATLMLPVPLWAASVTTVRISNTAEKSRVVFELSRSVTYTIFRMHKPERVVIDMQHSQWRKHAMKIALPNPVVKSVRHGMHKGVLRVVLDLNRKGLGMRSFLLKKMQGKPSRLVVDLIRQSGSHEVKAAHSHQHELVIAVDAGHGGEDPGAIGPHGLQEKKVTLAIAKKLVAMLNKQHGMRAVLTRKNDYFVPLKKRVRLVRQAHADVMISIHADAVRERSVKGSSVYTLAERGATPDRVAIALAAKENAADEMGGVHHAHSEVEDPMVRNILGDMAKRDSLNSSQILAETMIASLKKIGKVKYEVPKRARFVVLGALEIPSVLVEVDFISNPKQERKLRTSRYQRQLAAALFQASQHFLRRMGMLVNRNNKKTS